MAGGERAVELQWMESRSWATWARKGSGFPSGCDGSHSGVCSKGEMWSDMGFTYALAGMVRLDPVRAKVEEGRRWEVLDAVVTSGDGSWD